MRTQRSFGEWYALMLARRRDLDDLVDWSRERMHGMCGETFRRIYDVAWRQRRIVESDISDGWAIHNDRQERKETERYEQL